MGTHADAARYEHVKENPKPIIIPLMVLAALSFFAFYSFNPFKASSGWFFAAIERPESVVPAIVAAANIESFEEALHHVHSLAMTLSLIVAGTGILLAFTTYYWKKISADAVAKALTPLHRFLVNKWYFDELYEATAVKGTVGLSRMLAWFDGKIVDGVVNGTARWTLAITLGRKQNWKEDSAEPMLYLIFSAIVSVFAGWTAAAAMVPAAAGFGTLLGYGLLGLGIAGGTFFLLYAGVGGFDSKVVDGLVNLTAYSAGFFGLILRRVQTGRVQTYILFVVFGVMMFFFLYRAV
jgi:NADH:ubiquinone oxidoreductase subunit 5 (subunit L)/multisubunit Na+/H+ antiporter MnhA subunit